MIGSNQRSFILGVAENVPTIVFLALLQTTGDFRTAGWLGAIAAGATLTTFACYRLPSHPILLAINIYILLITPTIEALYWLGFKSQGDFLIAHTQVGVLLSVFGVGSLLTLFTEKKFIGGKCNPASVAWRLSLYMLIASAGAVIWSMAYEGNRIMAIALPLACLFGLRQFLVAGLKDRGSDPDLLASGAIASTGFGSENTLDGSETLA